MPARLVGSFGYPSLAAIPDGVLDGLIGACRYRAEQAAVERFRWHVIEPARTLKMSGRVVWYPSCVHGSRVGLSDWGQIEAYRLGINFWAAQRQLRRLWAEWCRRFGIAYDNQSERCNKH